MNKSHQQFMIDAIDIAKETFNKHDGGPIGAIIVKDNKVIGKGRSRVVLDNDPTAHAEIIAIRDACNNLGHYRLTHCILYTTSQPCPMCLSACYWAAIDQIFYACLIEDAQQIGFNDLFIQNELRKHENERQIKMTQILRETVLPLQQKWYLENKEWYNRIKDFKNE
jgi:guanine deaminase